MIKTIVVPIEYIHDGPKTEIGKKMFSVIESALTGDIQQLDVYIDNPSENETDPDSMIAEGVEFSQMVWEPTGQLIRFLSDTDTVKKFLGGFVNLQ